MNIRYPQDVSLLNEARKNWKRSSAVFASPMICRCRDVTKNAPEKIIWHLPEAKNTVQRKYGKPCENSLAMLQGTFGIRVLADQIYRTRANRSYCKEHGIRLSGPKLGRPGVNVKVDKNRNIRIIPTGSKWNVHLA